MRNPIALQQIAAHQDGLVTTAQCEATGYSPDDVKKQVRSRYWARVTRGVYLLDADLNPERPQRLMARAALLAAGDRAALVLHDAAALHGFTGLRDDGKIHISLPGNGAVPRRIGHHEVIPHQFVIAPMTTQPSQAYARRPSRAPSRISSCTPIAKPLSAPWTPPCSRVFSSGRICPQWSRSCGAGGAR